MAKRKAAATARVPMPGLMAARSSTPLPAAKPTTDKRYCNDPAHLCNADCVRAMREHKQPVNGTQRCSLVAAKNSVLVFRALMKWDEVSLDMPIPPESNTAGVIWMRFEQLVTGCVDHITANMTQEELYDLLGTYVDFADPLRASMASYMRIGYRLKDKFGEDPELLTQLNRLAKVDPVLKWIWDKLAL